jgi:hypothetical protein
LVAHPYRNLALATTSAQSTTGRGTDTAEPRSAGISAA